MGGGGITESLGQERRRADCVVAGQLSQWSSPVAAGLSVQQGDHSSALASQRNIARDGNGVPAGGGGGQAQEHLPPVAFEVEVAAVAWFLEV